MLITFGFSKIKPIEICVMQKSTTLSDKQVKFLNSSEWECIRVRADSGSSILFPSAVSSKDRMVARLLCSWYAFLLFNDSSYLTDSGKLHIQNTFLQLRRNMSVSHMWNGLQSQRNDSKTVTAVSRQLWEKLLLYYWYSSTELG